jgi:prophage regulatory protein
MKSSESRYAVSTGLVLERLPTVMYRTGLSSSEIYRSISVGRFPRPVKLGPRSSAWSAAEIDQWIEAGLAARSQGAV